jgi:hypothetical protein
MLSGVVDHLTPDGTVPQGGIDANAVLASLKAKIFGGAGTTPVAETA